MFHLSLQLLCSFLLYIVVVAKLSSYCLRVLKLTSILLGVHTVKMCGCGY